MESEYILIELKELSSHDTITKKELMGLLKKYASIISVYDLMMATAHMRKDGEYVHANYREKYLEVYIKYFIMRMKEVLENEDYNYKTNIDKKSFDQSFPMLERTFEKERLTASKDDKFPLIYVITALYTTFILEEPIHPVGSEFPGSLKVEKRNGEFYCPVKDNQKDNTNAICHLCLAEQTPDI
ncbi:Uncharacterized protein, UPF0305 family [Methanobrevibacter gottschalkii]|uniref:UPF0305 protein EDC42_1879 n=2 Tax=Methanobrevibacter gottschalkii TaxID=190974 RepID=A0A3N5AYU7_9EURY|nr:MULTISPECIES: DUF2115 domain-containing protein [Methanobrevibacter]MCQ2970419.1 DUF2115 domain-containing protein [archaeon]OED01041.1 hypothetical protein A9505_02560 [Methanobrevibacter sp. A27]RPF50234.1 uncharacterized protein (UPF0305 family) [Methanobrevibacter gottschalkii DSM 11977]SEL13881.1 Uncharacterized protein, UPF0305 family [Methanobrevibacter gottschalkii]